MDLSAAFDTVDHAILLRRLEVSYGLGGALSSWCRSYLDGRTQFICCGRLSSDPTPFICSVPQGSVLRPIFFLLYTDDVLQLIERYNLHPHGYADDTQVYSFCSPSSCWELREQVFACLDEVAFWMRSNRLQLNTSKAEGVWCAISRPQDQIPTDPIRVGGDLMSLLTSVRDLGIYLDSDASMRTHVSKTVSNCFAALRQLRSIYVSLFLGR